nr:hypothetical protein [Tanacetum cinerariifolium]
AVICLATGKKFNFSKYIFDNMVRNVDSPSKFVMYPWFLKVMINAQVDDLSSHTNQYTSPTLTQKVFANMRRVGKGFFGVETPLFATMLVPLPSAEEVEDVEEHQPDTSESSMSILNTLMETSATLSQKVAHLEQDKIAQALEIIKLKKRVKKLEKQRRSKSSGLKRLRKVEGRIEAIDADEDITLVDAETQVNLEVPMTMAQTLIKMKAKRARLLDEQMAKRLHDEEVEQAAAMEKQEKKDLEKTKALQKQYEDKQENIDWNTVAE